MASNKNKFVDSPVEMIGHPPKGNKEGREFTMATIKPLSAATGALNLPMQCLRSCTMAACPG